MFIKLIELICRCNFSVTHPRHIGAVATPALTQLPTGGIWSTAGRESEMTAINPFRFNLIKSVYGRVQEIASLRSEDHPMTLRYHILIDLDCLLVRGGPVLILSL